MLDSNTLALLNGLEVGYNTRALQLKIRVNKTKLIREVSIFFILFYFINVGVIPGTTQLRVHSWLKFLSLNLSSTYF